MSIQIKVLEKPNIKKVKMLCDNCIDEKLKMYPMVDDAFSTASFNIIVGRMGYGKTSLITSFMKTIFRKAFENVFVIIPPNSRASIENDIYGKNLPEDQIYDTLTEEGLTDIYNRLQESTSEGYNSILIIDDFQAQMKEANIVKALQKIITKMRHLRVSIWLLQQNFQALTKSLRELASNLIIYNLGKSQLTKIFDEVIELPKDKYQELIDLAFKEKHDWLLFNFHRSKKVYRMFDEIIFHE
jgi:thymidine kinase